MQAPALLMIHGLVGSQEYFDPAARITGASVHTCDLLGYGTLRDVSPDRLTLAQQADHVLAYLHEAGCERAWLLGHSMGGAVAMLAADRAPEMVSGVINVEGNFTLKDAFWSSRIISKTPEQWATEYERMQQDVGGWLTCCGVEPTTRRVEWAGMILAHQPPATVYRMSRALVEETQRPEFLQTVGRVIDRGLPVHLLAGEKSAAAWDVPDFVRRTAASYAEQPAVGHLMMLEDPDTFGRLVDRCLAAGVSE